MSVYPSCSTCKHLNFQSCLLESDAYHKRITYRDDCQLLCCDLSIPCNLYTSFDQPLPMLDVNVYKQTRILETEIENCVSCPMHHRKDSNLFYCEYSDVDMHYRDINDITTFPKACSLVIGNLIKRCVR